MQNELRSITRIFVAGVIGMLLTWLGNYIEITTEQTETILQLSATIAVYGLDRLLEYLYPDSGLARILVFKKPEAGETK